MERGQSMNEQNPNTGNIVDRFEPYLEERLRDPKYRQVWENEMPLIMFGATVAALREQRGLTQRMLAEQSGMKQPAVNRIERGLHRPNLETITRLANVLKGNLIFDEATGYPMLVARKQRRARENAQRSVGSIRD
jgi:ribosome-binding protein aMBF1 (putative translation factor)